MRLFRNGMLVVAALSLCASAASAGHGNGHAYGHYKHQRYVAYYPQPVYVQPAPVVYQACAPRYVTYYPQRVMVVRPTPYVQIGARLGAVSISALFGGHQRYDYGCNFCDAHFQSYGAYENHVHNCAYRPANTRIECRQWDDQGYSQWQGRNPSSCRRSNDRYNGDEDDRGYNDDQQYDNRRYNDDQDDQGGYYDGR